MAEPSLRKVHMSVDSKRFRTGLFLTLLVGWIVVVVYLWRVGASEFGAAAIGAGPVLLYAVFQEYVQQPIVVPEGEVHYKISIIRQGNPSLSNLPDLRQAISAAYPNTQFDLAYPVIVANLSVKNKGLATAQDCYCYSLTDEYGMFYGRWGDEVNTQTTDLHPGTKQTISLVRIYPKDFELWNMDANEERKYIIKNVFNHLEPGRTTEGVKIGNYEYRIQRPVHIAKERRMLNNPSGAFAGYELPPKETYTLKVGFGAKDYNKNIGKEFKISVEDAIKEGNWELSIESHYSTLVEKLADAGWNRPSSLNG